MTLYDIYSEEIALIKDFPNVYVLTDRENRTDILKNVACSITREREHAAPWDVAKAVKKCVHSIDEQEATVNVSYEVSTDFGQDDEYDYWQSPRFIDMYMLESEKDYYENITNLCMHTIKAEIQGVNPYGVKQGLDSRRFYYNSDTCISSIHFLPRDGTLNVLCTLRSTDVDKNAESDLTFLADLSAKVNKNFDWPCHRINLTVRLNNAHVRKDLQKET